MWRNCLDRPERAQLRDISGVIEKAFVRPNTLHAVQTVSDLDQPPLVALQPEAPPSMTASEMALWAHAIGRK